ncbi:MFS transporter [Nocardiopsis composta]
MLIASRAVAAAGAAVYTPNAAVMASVLSPPRFQGRAMAVVVGGMTAATALGVPLGTWLGTALGWRAALWMVALTALVALAGMALLPGGVRLLRRPRRADARAGPPPAAGGHRADPARLLGSFTVFAYIAPVFAPVTGGGAVGAALLWVWGLASVAGNLAAGRASDARGPRTVMLVALPVLIALFLLVEPAAATLPGAFAWMLLYGGFGWLVAVPQQQRAIAVDPPAAPVLIGLNSSALYGGMSLGGITGGAALAWLEPAQLGYLGAALLAPALLLLLWAERRRG